MSLNDERALRVVMFSMLAVFAAYSFGWIDNDPVGPSLYFQSPTDEMIALDQDACVASDYEPTTFICKPAISGASYDKHFE